MWRGGSEETHVAGLLDYEIVLSSFDTDVAGGANTFHLDVSNVVDDERRRRINPRQKRGYLQPYAADRPTATKQLTGIHAIPHLPHLNFNPFERILARLQQVVPKYNKCLSGSIDLSNTQRPHMARRRRPPRPGALTELPPLKILSQIAILQVIYYVVASILILFTTLVAGRRFSLDSIFSWKSLRGDTTTGWMLGTVWMLNAVIGYVHALVLGALSFHRYVY